MYQFSLRMKYIKDKYVKALKKGNMFLPSSELFKNMEKNEGDTTIGDSSEGDIIDKFTSEEIKDLTIQYNDKNRNLKRYNIKKDLIADENGYVMTRSFTPDETRHWGIYCYTHVFSNDSSVFNHKVKFHFMKLHNWINISEQFTLKKSFVNNLYREVGGENRSLVLLDEGIFRRIRKLSDNFDFLVKYGPVKYYKNSDNSNVDRSLDYNSKAINAIFTKSEKYSKQKEGRIVIYRDVDKFGHTIKLGDLSKYVLNTHEKKPRFRISSEQYIFLGINPEKIFYNSYILRYKN